MGICSPFSDQDEDDGDDDVDDDDKRCLFLLIEIMTRSVRKRNMSD